VLFGCAAAPSSSTQAGGALQSQPATPGQAGRLICHAGRRLGPRKDRPLEFGRHGSYPILYSRRHPMPILSPPPGASLPYLMFHKRERLALLSSPSSLRSAQGSSRQHLTTTGTPVFVLVSGPVQSCLRLDL
jgi:hypothetical protein